MDTRKFDARVERNAGSFVGEIAALCAFPSVSAKGAMLPETAVWVVARLAEAGFRAGTVERDGSPPAIWAEAGSGPRTLLFYNHYDVQPEEPLDLWRSDPFALVERDGYLVARGVADNKADLLSRIHAIETWRATEGDLPLRVRWLIEGEEEIGSPHLEALIAANRDRWTADGCAWEGSGRDEQDHPVIHCGVKGLLYVELSVRALERDLHSAYGGIAPNAAWRLVDALRTIRDPDGRVTVDGIAERVRSFTESERAVVARIPLDAAATAKSLGLPRILRNLAGMAFVEELMNGATANIAGIVGGWTGPGEKTVIPAEASVLMDFRFAPDLTADEVEHFLRGHLARRGFGDVRVRRASALDPTRTPVDHAIVRASLAAWEGLARGEVYVYPTSPATGPGAAIVRGLGAPIVQTGGVAWAGDRMHSPNECIRAADYPVAVRYWGRFLERFAAM